MHAVILDIDGTLLESAADDDRLYRLAVVDVLGEVRMRSDMHAYDPVTDSAILEQIAGDNGIAFGQQLLDDVRRAFVTRLEDFIAGHGPFRPLPGARRFVRGLRDSRLAEIAVATGGWGTTAGLKLRTAGFDMDGVVLKTSDDATTRTGIMRSALDSLAGPFDSITYFGDGAWDERATRELGWRFQPVGKALGGIENFDDLARSTDWDWLV